MKVFVSWSGERSKKIAGILCDFLAKVIQAVDPFYSLEIEKGTKWAKEIESELEGTKFGIVCLTPDNLTSPWIHYEAGALSKTKDAVIWTFLVELSNTDVKQPLGQFQHTQFNEKEVFELLKSINKRVGATGGKSVQEKSLKKLFDVFCKELKDDIGKVRNENITDEKQGKLSKVRTDRDILEEILETIRSLEQGKNKIADASAEDAHSAFFLREMISEVLSRHNGSYSVKEVRDIVYRENNVKFSLNTIDKTLNKLFSQGRIHRDTNARGEFKYYDDIPF